MAVSWTKDQIAAIESKGSTIVSASAGTGKTAVLTEKVTRQILKGVNISDILLMTFSNKAAEEMKIRIAAKLDDALLDTEKISNPKVKSVRQHHLYNQMNALSAAPIQTIHSFCCNVIRQNYFVVGVDPKFKVLSGADAAVTMREAVNTALADEYEKLEPEFQALCECTGSSETVEDIIISAYKKVSSILDGFKWLDCMIEEYNFEKGELPRFARDVLTEDFANCMELLSKSASLIKGDPSDTKIKKARSAIYTEINTFKTALEYLKNNNIDGINPYLFKCCGSSVRFPEGCEEAKAFRDKAKGIYKMYKDTFYLNRQLERVREMYPVAKYFSELLKKFDKEFSAQKRIKNVIDFSDMEKMTYAIVSDPATSEMYRNSFVSVYVDEYQDTSPIQEAIINCISRKDNLFCVGDLKQSIYRFRSSDPILFKNRVQLYTANPSKTVISLKDNFRSSLNILNCANDVFKNVSKTSDEMNYDESQCLIHGREDFSDVIPVRVDVISGSDNDKDDAEIANICRIIKNRIGKPVFDPSICAFRPATYGDFTVLSRKVLKYTEKINKIFTANEIPYQIERNGQLLETVEVQVALSLLRLIINRNNDLDLITVIHNGFWGFNDEDLSAIREHDMSGSFISNIEAIAALGEGSVSEKCAKLIAFLDVCSLKKKQQYSLTKLVGFAFNYANLYDVIATMPNASHCIDNILLLENMASEYENSTHEKLYSFLKHIDSIAKSGESVEEAQNTAVEDAVKITTIHQSKGLEYPIVILAFMGVDFTRQGHRSNVIIDKDSGIGLNYYNLKTREKGKNLLRTSIERNAARKEKEEEMRLLYVAMTRAREELYIQFSESEKISIDNECSSMSSWIMSTVNLGKEKLEGIWQKKTVLSEEIAGYLDSSINCKERGSLKVKIGQTNTSVREEIASVVIPKTISASGLEQVGEYSIEMLNMPDFYQKGNTRYEAALQGTAVHNYLRNLTIKHGMSVSELREDKERQYKSGLLTEGDYNLISDKLLNNISRLTSHECFKDLELSSNIMKERNFYTEINSSQVTGTDTNQEVLVRCILDLAYEISSGFVIIDYKTDKVSNNINEIIQRHKKQIDIYSNCLEKIYQKPVVKRFLALLDVGQLVEI